MMVFVKDPCGFICIIFTYAAVVYADYVVIRWVVVQTMSDSLWGPFHVLIFNTLVFLLSYAHFKAMLSDPGAVPLPKTRVDFSDIHTGELSAMLQNKDDWTVCTRCETYRPPRAHHCRICKRCIKRMDHHCPWINNCVGEKNQRYFVQFLIYVTILAVYAIALVSISWLRECPLCSREITIKQTRMPRSCATSAGLVQSGWKVWTVEQVIHCTWDIDQAQMDLFWPCSATVVCTSRI
ncbi:palmitoyltransferase ZDHHC3 isoform X2 [Diaphorina citri]|uniref:Palmitoyltransferase n=1 Tax=Diaphorina citri TaxID=121845 RepID=A0A3Q0J8B6_DIACI|nr:palmitoyltransferase ZDHHC3 isoform X2 [Diaphorina citri]